MRKNTGILLLLSLNLVSAPDARSQAGNNGAIEGRVFNAINNEPVPFANVVIWGTTIGSVSDLDGSFLFTGLEPGYIQLRVSSVGFKPYTSEPLLVTNAKKVFIDIPLEETSVDIDEITVKASPFRKKDESPVSLQRIGIEEIEKNPGGNRDISKVLQSLPGVASTVSYRNDVIVRGGGSAENRFYLDDVEIPNLNHFATQGASGGPVGILNIDFIKEVNFYSGAFPADRGNALSSVLEFRQVDGNRDRLEFKGSVGASDAALTLNGPIGDNTTFLLSLRKSYLQLLFAALELPFLPNYTDTQFKVKTRLGEKQELTLLGLGSYDINSLNLEADETEEQRLLLDALPENNQWSYTLGAVYKFYHERGYDTWVLSRNHLDNRAYKYAGNIEEDSLKLLDYASDEIENKFRYEHRSRLDGGLKLNYGANLDYAVYTNNTFNRTFTGGQPFTVNYQSDLDVFRWGVFGQASRDFLKEKLTLSLGVRMDANDFSGEMRNLFDQFSPRFSASYMVLPRLYFNFNTGRYYQQPPYTTLGFRDNAGTLVNRVNGLKYIRCDHLVGGIEFLPGRESKLSIEGFYKWYHNYPVSVADKVSIASKGGDFGTFGDEEVVSEAGGRAYGMEVLYRNRELFGFNTILTYTLVRSESQQFNDLLLPLAGYVPTAWDNRHLLNMTLIRKFKGNWQAGMKWRFVGGAPYTPYDLVTSARREAWDARGSGFLDYARFNTERLPGFNQLDVRVDKEWYFSDWTLNLYMDVQNILNYKADSPAQLYRVEDDQGNPVVANPDDPYDEQRYELKLVKTQSGTILPTVGIIVEF